jgi:diacylglycerol kinase (ATP)
MEGKVSWLYAVPCLRLYKKVVALNLSMKHLLFIINSILLRKSGINISHLIDSHLDRRKFFYDIYYSEYPGHCTELAASNRDKYDIIVAVGGDGTINETGQALSGTDTMLGIIPIGSGNGLARTILKTSPSVLKSIQIINANNVRSIDMGLINDIPFFNMAGVGFDAEVAHRYNSKVKRGFLAYLKTVAELFFIYQSRKYEVSYENRAYSINAFLISFANSSQWGYNAHICPGADPSDGVLGVTIIRAFPKIIILYLAWLLFTKKINKSRFVQTFMTKSIRVQAPGEISGHIDGNPVVFQNYIEVEIVHNAIKVIAV